MSLFLLSLPVPPTLLPGPSGSHLLPFGGQAAIGTVKSSLGGEIQTWPGHASFPPSFRDSSPPSDIIFHPWKKEENGNQSRVILYTITLTNPLAPKTATVRETQVSQGQGPGRVAGASGPCTHTAGERGEWSEGGAFPVLLLLCFVPRTLLPTDHVQGEPRE